MSTHRKLTVEHVQGGYNLVLPVFDTAVTIATALREDSAKHLALCWNTHEVVVAALEAIVDAWSAGDAIGRGPRRDSEPRASVHAALAAAKGVQDA